MKTAITISLPSVFYTAGKTPSRHVILRNSFQGTVWRYCFCECNPLYKYVLSRYPKVYLPVLQRCMEPQFRGKAVSMQFNCTMCFLSFGTGAKVGVQRVWTLEAEGESFCHSSANKVTYRVSRSKASHGWLCWVSVSCSPVEDTNRYCEELSRLENRSWSCRSSMLFFHTQNYYVQVAWRYCCKLCPGMTAAGTVPWNKSSIALLRFLDTR